MSSEFRAESLAQRLVASNKAGNDDNEDAIFAELEEEIENNADSYMREAGLDKMRKEIKENQEMRHIGHGQYTEITDEKQVVRLTARDPLCVVHFYHSKFRRCAIMDKHLAKLAPKYFGTLFLRVFVENVPWLVERLGIKVLPCVICFVDGVSKDRLVGFDELGNEDGFETATLELRLSMCGVVRKTPAGGNTVYKVSTGQNVSADEPEFDLD